MQGVRLPDTTRRRVVKMAIVDHMPQTVIAKLMEVNRDTVRMILRESGIMPGDGRLYSQCREKTIDREIAESN